MSIDMQRDDSASLQTSTEVIAFCSGKGGTGKSLLCSCLGYALIRGNHRVLMIDGDPATDGLSLFILGPEGSQQVGSFSENNTFVGALNTFKATGKASFEPRQIHRRGEGDHGITYTALISGRGLYGDKAFMGQIVPDLDQATFRAAIADIIQQAKISAQYDYILIDTRGGFAFESADICALADSFIVITEPDNTSFYQDRNLLASITAAATELRSPSLLRAIIVNKAIDSVAEPGASYLDGLEVSFRNELVREFKLSYKETYPVPVALEVLMAYKVQKIPYVTNPESNFCLATLAAFSGIVQLVTSKWTPEQVDRWNELVERVRAAVSKKYQKLAEAEARQTAKEKEQEELRRRIEKADETVARLRADMSRQEMLFESERRRSDFLLERVSPTSESVKLELGKTGEKALKRWLNWRNSAIILAIVIFGIGISTLLIGEYRARQDALASELAASRAQANLIQLENQVATQGQQFSIKGSSSIGADGSSGITSISTPKPTANALLSPTLPLCLSATWKEGVYANPSSPDQFSWTISVDKSLVQVKRTDSFAQGTFSQKGNKWVGNLKWGNGETWENVILSPSYDCKRIDTNQQWFYIR